MIKLKLNWNSKRHAIVLRLRGGICLLLGGFRFSVGILLFRLSTSLLSLRLMLLINRTSSIFKGKIHLSLWQDMFWLLLIIAHDGASRCCDNFVYELQLVTKHGIVTLSNLVNDVLSVRQDSRQDFFFQLGFDLVEPKEDSKSVLSQFLWLCVV